LQAGLSLGLILGVIGALRVAAWSLVGHTYFHRDLYGPHWPLVALTVGFALIGVVLWGSLSGSMLPFVLRRFGADPATSSAPFVATLVDVTGLIIYFSIALLIMRGAML
jgi:magnesium transporter